MKKRLLSVLLLLALAFTLLPTTALADDDPTVRMVKTSQQLTDALADGNVTTIRLLGTEEVLLKKNKDKNVVNRDLIFDMQGQELRGSGTLTIQKNCTLTIINGGTFSGSIENHGTLIGGGAYTCVCQRRFRKSPSCPSVPFWRVASCWQETATPSATCARSTGSMTT